MLLFVKPLAENAAAFSLEVEAHDTIENIKFKVHDTKGLAPDIQRLLFCGKQLADGCTLRDYCIEKESTLILMVRLRGGMYTSQSGRDGAFGICKPSESSGDRFERLKASLAKAKNGVHVDLAPAPVSPLNHRILKGGPRARPLRLLPLIKKPKAVQGRSVKLSTFELPAIEHFPHS